LSNEFTRRSFLQLGTAAAAVAAVNWGAGSFAWAGDGLDEGFRHYFERPKPELRPKFRWWWPDGLVDPEEIKAEIDQIADAGFGGAEIAAVTHSISNKTPLNVATNGWGTAAWVAGVGAALEQARERGLTIDLTVGPSWPAAVPTITANSEEAVKELAYGDALVAAGASFSGPVPEPVTTVGSAVTVKKLVYLHAVRVNAAFTTTKLIGLEAASSIDLTSAVVEGALTWTAPADGAYHLISYWERGSGQTPESGPHTAPVAYVVDHFSKKGTQAIIDFWEANILTDKIRKLLKRSGGALFEDSIELETKGLNWTTALPAEFEKRRGYSVLPFLPAVVLKSSNQVFAFDPAISRRVQHDYWQTVSELFNEHHFTMLRDWAHSLGLQLRSQPYGLQTDAIESASILDVPEGETIGFKNLDDYRALAGGRDLAGKKILSVEAGAALGTAYSYTWDRFLRTMSGAYAAGVNQTVVHGFAYATAPGVSWPGFAAFSPYSGAPGYSEAWGPRQPTWKHVSDVSGYLSRVHAAMQTGTPRIDVAFFRQTGYAATGIGVGWFTASGIPVGWTHQLVSAGLLDLPNATVSGGRLAADGPSYKVLVVEGDRFYGSEPTLELATAKKLLKFTQQGLPLIFIGAWNAATIPGRAVGDENTQLRAVLAELFAQPKVRTAAALTDVPAALADLGIAPDVSHPTSTLLNFRRVAKGMDVYYLANGKHAESSKGVVAIDHDVTLARTTAGNVPYLLDAWTGKITRIAQYTEEGAGKVTVRVKLEVNETALILIGPKGYAGDKTGGKPYVVSTQADAARFVDGDLVVRDATAGTYPTVLSDGRTVAAKIDAVPAPITLSAWDLAVSSWLPGATATETTTEKISVSLTSLAAWPAIPALQDVSGIGTYTATITLGADWPRRTGAYLELGEVFDTVRVTLNGKQLDPVDLINPVVDLGTRLVRGTNTLVVEVASTLNNRLRVTNPAVFGGSARQAYGLVGPVRIVPYGQVAL
jgi:hypothetical protein